ncbi:F-box/LRR-repeat protein [Cardamine amara subsp. amara]|uniref:F-box/LRR-repeat protein n=1 Tax=Cardamine amara subsp. amara TaxID=228776 RepID=A0ABD1BRW3_CARAN
MIFYGRQRRILVAPSAMADGPSLDFISSLPDEILHHILSFLPTNLAIQTCVLSKRWRHIWRNTPSISLECNEFCAHKVHKTLKYHKARKLLSFRLDFHFDSDLIDFPGGTVTHHRYFAADAWIKFALSRHPENLSLDFCLSNYKKYMFPDKFYATSSIKRLHLALNNCTTLIPRSKVFWPSLKHLCLDRCNIPDESAAKILSGCPVLESLTLTLCSVLVRLDLAKSIHLKRLEIDLKYSGPKEIVAPHVQYLRLKTYSRPCSLVDISSVTEAKLDIYYVEFAKMDYFLYMMDLKIVAKLQNTEKLTLGAIFLQALTLAEFRGVPFPMLKITSLTLETKIFRYIVPGIARLLQNSHGLKKLTLHLMKCEAIEEMYLHSYSDSRGLEFGIFPTSREPKLIALFIEFLLGNTKTLETLVVRLENNLDATKFEELLQMAQTISHNYNDVSILVKQNTYPKDFVHESRIQNLGKTSVAFVISQILRKKRLYLVLLRSTSLLGGTLICKVEQVLFLD